MHYTDRKKTEIAARLPEGLKTAVRILWYLTESWFFCHYLRLPQNILIVMSMSAAIWFLERTADAGELRTHRVLYGVFGAGTAVMLILCRHMTIDFVYYYSDISENYISGYGITDLFALPVLTRLLMYLFCQTIHVLSGSFFSDVMTGKRGLRKESGAALSDTEVLHEGKRAALSDSKNSRKWFAIYFCILFTASLPYFILYYPGLLYGDSSASISQALGEAALSSHHPIMYTMFIRFCLWFGNLVGGGNTAGCAIYSLLQMLYLSAVEAYTICWLRKKGISGKICLSVLAYYSLSRFFGQHAVSMWKDPVFSASVSLYGIRLFDAVTSESLLITRPLFLAQGMLLALVICFSRNNGIYVVLFSFICLAAACVSRHALKKSRRFLLGTLFCAVFSLVLQGPVYQKLGITATPAESYGIALQQIARTVVYGGNMSQEEADFLDQIFPLEKYSEYYCPGVVDPIKWDSGFDTEFFNSHLSEFRKVWFSLLLKNPKIYFDSWCLSTGGFWGLTFWDLNDYTNNIMMSVPQNDAYRETYQIDSHSLLGEESSVTAGLKKIFSLKTPMPSIALCLWLSIFMILLSCVKGKWICSMIFMPCIGNILTLLIATPITYWPRYGLSFLYLLPVVLCFPFLLPEGRQAD